jgi:hypothetical protein
MAVTDAERDQLLEWMEHGRSAIESAVCGLSAAQWHFQAEPETWSIAQAAQHISLSEASIFARIQRLIAEGPSSAEEIAQTEGKGSVLARKIPSRLVKVKSPQALDTKETCESPENWLALFRAAREPRLEFLRSTDADLHSYVFPHFVFQQLSAFQWVQMANLHAERHAKQMEEVKTQPSYPAR